MATSNRDWARTCADHSITWYEWVSQYHSNSRSSFILFTELIGFMGTMAALVGMAVLLSPFNDQPRFRFLTFVNMAVRFKFFPTCEGGFMFTGLEKQKTRKIRVCRRMRSSIPNATRSHI